MENKFIVFFTAQGVGIEWLGEWDTQAEAQTHLDEQMKANSVFESGWIVQTVGRNYSNT